MSLSKYSIRTIVLLACVMVFAAAGYAQFRAGIQGTVTDTTGAAVKGATVKVTNQETGASQEVTTGDTGFYSVAHLAPGLYTVAVSFTGFKTNVIKDVQVSAETPEGVDLVLQPGAVTEQITVSGDTLPTLQTEDASLTGTISKQEVQELPQFRGDPFELLRLTPGVFGEGARDSGGNAANFPGYTGVGGSNRSVFQIENAVQVSANGSRVEANGYQIDGVSTNSQGWGGATVITPNAEAVKEVKIDVSPYSAENGHGAGAIVQVVSQNGTNDLHGSAVLRLHSPSLNAFQRWGGPNGASPNRDNQLLHNYLGSLGGPILKNKLFAFFSFERMKVTGGTYRNSSWVETSQWIGKLPGSSLAAKIFAVPGSGFFNPKILTAGTTCAGLGLAVSTTTCQDSTGLNGTQVVTGGVDIGSNTGTSGTLVNNANGGGLDGSPDIALVEYDGRNDTIAATQYNGRVDYNATKKDLIAFSLFYVPQTKTFLPGSWVGGRQYDLFNTDAKNETAALLWTRTINSTMVNEARMNVTRWYQDELKGNPQAPWGVPIVNITIPQNTESAGFSLSPGTFHQTTYTFRDTFSNVHNNHVLKFGGELDKEQNNIAHNDNARPSFNFNNLWSFANDVPISEGSTNFDPKTGVPTNYRKYIRVSTYSLFGQDNWKLKPNLTLTLGLRYDYFAPIRDKYGRLSNLILGSGSNALTGAKIHTGGDFTNPDRNNFGPQLGFAFSPRSLLHHEFNNKFVLRGGAGLAYNRVQENTVLNASGNPPDFVNASLAMNQVVYAFSSGGIHSFSGFPANPATILTFDPNTGLPNGGQFLAKPNINGSVQNLATPYTWHYSMEGQYEFRRDWVAALSYQGSQSRKYPRTINDALLFPLNPNINSVNMVQTDVNSRYNALLARITHRFSKGLELNASYRFSRSTDQCSSDAACNQTYPINQNTELGPSDFDVTHSFTAYALWELPLVGHRRDWLYTLAGGWKLSGILTHNSGFPWTPTFEYVGSACDTLKANLNFNDANCKVRAASYLGGANSDYSTSTFQKAGGNFPAGSLTYFTAPPDPRTFTTLPVPATGRNSFRGPRYTGIDMSFGKRFTLPKVRFLGENAGFEIKANAFNIFNKVNATNFGFNSNSTKIGTGNLVCPDSSNPCDVPLVYTISANPNFGRATGALGGRVIEFFAKFSF